MLTRLLVRKLATEATDGRGRHATTRIPARILVRFLIRILDRILGKTPTRKKRNTLAKRARKTAPTLPR